ncbi:cytochrome b reductase 1-like isoform X1 [Acyrthosiphon pisum]|uniref:Cytochrome b561 domain-containing protein n=2 Tax=Acyrthosiphon pisum TaxID=7029 RepID=A0A8R2B1X3_ACYPI|nr:cytochrome b reductase 1-like isoform X1 [Acyrthosiphon pisum]|eukprot:XP_008179951.1 PREDICTED: cytochrome b reductase 1-like isoform X1 [Acyrthosiphon pisum]
MSRKRLKTTPELENNRIEEAVTLNNMTEQNRNTQSQNFSHVGAYSSLYTICQIVGLLLIFSVFYWIINFRGGFGFTEPKIIFNWHPLFMTIGFIYLFANSILHYRTFRSLKKRDLKNHHAIIHGFIIVLVLLAGWASFASHMYSNPPIPDLYSLHSWLGVVTISMFLSQFVSGFVSFLFPGIAAQYKEAVMPYHIFFGIFNFVLAIATSVLGFSEKLFFVLEDKYKTYPKEGLFGNFIGLLCIFYGGLVVFMVTKPEFKRQPKPEDGVLLTGALE